MTKLRNLMIDDMQLRNFAPNTQAAYVRAVMQFSRHFNAAPETLNAAHAREFLLHLVQDRRVSWNT